MMERRSLDPAMSGVVAGIALSCGLDPATSAESRAAVIRDPSGLDIWNLIAIETRRARHYHEGTRFSLSISNFEGDPLMKEPSRVAGLCAVIVVIAACIVGVTAPSAQEPTYQDIDWPIELGNDQYEVVMYEPQLESFENDKIQSRTAISIKAKGDSAPAFGAIWMEGRVATDFDTRLVSLLDVKVTASKFPDMDEETVEKLSRYLENEIPQWDMTFSLDKLLAGMATLESQGGAEEKFNNDPPEIIYVDHPAVLVVIDGDPIITDLEGFDLKYVANSPFFIVQDPKSKVYYLKGGEYWYTAKDLMGEWTTTTKFSSEVEKVVKAVDEEEKKQAAEMAAEETADTGNQADQAAPAEPEEDPGEAGVPEIIVRTKPAELVQIDGEPQMASIEGTDLLYVQNTESDVVMDISTQKYYVLLSGRWFATSSLASNDWTFVANDALPSGFEQIPAASDMGQVRASVSGTQEAKEAVLENTIPQTAEVDRNEAKLTVTYDGDPKFEKCSDPVAYALNTDKQVLLINNTYYCCDDAIWFVSQGPEGPWVVATEVPKEVQDIPADCPAHNVKYVYIYDSNPTTVYVGYTPAYTGAYYYHGCVVWGTGWWYQPWWGHYYYPRPVTYGFRFHWNPVTGWGCSFGVSFGWLHIGVGRPWYGGWWGPGGYRHGYRHGYHRGYRHGYHRGARAGYRAGYRAGSRNSNGNVYRNRSTGVKRTGATTAQNRQRQQGARGTPSTQAKKQPKKSNAPNNVYADKNGNVHRQQGNDWQQRQGNNWTSQNKSQTNKSQQNRSQQNLNKQSQSRQRGNQKATQNRSAQSRSRSGGGGRRR
jgi:hypothetical protein